MRIIGPNGATITSSTAEVTVSKASGSGSLSGTLKVNAINGVATFTDLAITGSGLHTLSFSVTAIAPATSAAFDVAPTTATVSDLATLKAAIANSNITTITFANDITTDEQILIQRSLTINGAGHQLIKAATTNLNIDGLKHTIFVAPTVGANNIHAEGVVVAINNLTVDANQKSYGVIAYDGATLNLDTVTIKNSKGAGLTVNAATVTATLLTTQSNSWGAVNVDYGVQSYAQHASIFTLISGTLNEQAQIYSDKALAADAGTKPAITVTADGYSVGTNGTVKYWYIALT